MPNVSLLPTGPDPTRVPAAGSPVSHLQTQPRYGGRGCIFDPQPTSSQLQAQLLPEVASALSTAALSPLLNFHKMAAVTRLFTAVCRLLEQRERVLFLACDLLRKPLSPPELPVVTGMVGVWPVVFARRLDMEVVVSGRLNPAAVELQPLSYAVEVVVTATMRQGGLSQHHVSKLHTLCGWSRGQVLKDLSLPPLAPAPSLSTDHLCKDGGQAGTGSAAASPDQSQSDRGAGALSGLVQTPPLPPHLPFSAHPANAVLVQGMGVDE